MKKVETMALQATAKTGTIPDRIILEQECAELTQISRATRWRLEKIGNFPKRIQISTRRIGWRLSDISIWLETRPAVELKSAA